MAAKEEEQQSRHGPWPVDYEQVEETLDLYFSGREFYDEDAPAEEKTGTVAERFDLEPKNLVNLLQDHQAADYKDPETLENFEEQQELGEDGWEDPDPESLEDDPLNYFRSSTKVEEGDPDWEHLERVGVQRGTSGEIKYKNGKRYRQRTTTKSVEGTIKDPDARWDPLAHED